MPELRGVYISELRIWEIKADYVILYKNRQIGSEELQSYFGYDMLLPEQPCYRVVDLYSTEWGVLMDKKPFDFKDLMAFGMFILALLTFVFANLK